MERKYTLFTNLSYVGVNDIRTHTNALLLAQDAGTFDRQELEYKIRGFKTEASCETFDMRVKSLEYVTEDWQGNVLMVGQNDKPKSIMGGTVLRFKEGLKIDLWLDDMERPIDMMDWKEEIDPDHPYGSGMITEVWKELSKKVALYWRAPNMPLQQYVPAHEVRMQLRV